jgi:hypothetical protein
MRPAILMVLCLGLGSACDKSIYRSAEGQFCSSSDDDDPYYECLLGMGLVCANTYSTPVLDDKGTEVRFQPVWLCRQACAPGGAACFQVGDVCCKTTIYGRSYPDRPYACAPEALCDDEGDAGAKPDARTRDTAGDRSGDGADDAAPDVASDAPAHDAGTDDAPGTPDAGAPDAPIDASGDASDDASGGAD